jgi:hypothetical protein
MQAFHNWLTSTASHPNLHQDRLLRLTRVSRAQILKITSDLTWYIWYAEGAGNRQ